MTTFDHERVSRAIGVALAGPGGVGLVVKVFCGLPGVVLTPARRGLFRSQPERIQIGDWRYEVTPDGRLGAAHLVNGIVIAEEVLAAAVVGPHIARALGQVVSSYGPTLIPNIDAALEVLESAGPGF
jgi:NAD(P)-dependent dehydrogenase (short-subunit alcohol dehydrogenase family)